MAENRDLAVLREEIPAQREDGLTHTARVVLEGLATVANLALPGRCLARRRPAARGLRR